MSRSPIQTVVRKKPWTRRELFKIAPLGAAGLGVAGLAWFGAHRAHVERTVGTCRFCLMRCGIECVVEDGRLKKVEGHLASRTRGFVCEHGYALRELVHSHERVQHPLIRRDGVFHEVDWNEALAFVAQKLHAVKERFGARALAIQTGWPFVRHPMVNFLHRFARAFGSPNVATVSSLCEASLRMGQALTVGSKYSPDVRRAKTLLIWGANPPVTAPPFAHLVADKARTGNLVVVDPVRTTLAKEATLHLRVRPGTDGALALGLVHQVLRRGTVAPALQEKLHGLAELSALAAQYPLARVEELTSVPQSHLERVVTMLLDSRPIGIWQGLGVEHHVSGVQTVRAISTLEVLCERFENADARSLVSPPSAHFHDEMLPALYRMRTPTPAPPPLTEAPIGAATYPLFERYNREAQGELFPEAILRDTPYPLRALILWGSNALVTSSGTREWEGAAEKLELLVTIDSFFSASAQRSDVVLPASTFAESPDVDADDEGVAAKSLVPVQGSSKPDFTILTELARAVGLGAWFPWSSFAEAMNAPHEAWMQNEKQQPKPHANARADFGTPTGKAEFASTVLEELGLEALPVWNPPPEIPQPDFPLRLVTGPRPRARINSQFGASPSVRARMREPELLVHPTVANANGITHGERIDVVSPHGRISIRAVVTDDVHPECVVMPSGWHEANPNWLIHPTQRDVISAFPALRSGICRLEKKVS